MSGAIKKSVIRRIAARRGVSLGIAAEIYNLKSIKEKERLCCAEREYRRKHIRDLPSDLLAKLIADGALPKDWDSK